MVCLLPWRLPSVVIKERNVMRVKASYSELSLIKAFFSRVNWMWSTLLVHDYLRLLRVRSEYWSEYKNQNLAWQDSSNGYCTQQRPIISRTHLSKYSRYKCEKRFVLFTFFSFNWKEKFITFKPGIVYVYSWFSHDVYARGHTSSVRSSRQFTSFENRASLLKRIELKQIINDKKIPLTSYRRRKQR